MTERPRIWMARHNAHAAGDGEATPSAKAGMLLTIRYETGETERFLLGRRAGRDAGVKVYSTLSPLGHAIAGARVGEQRIYSMPQGPEHRVRLLEAVPYHANHGMSKRKRPTPQAVTPSIRCGPAAAEAAHAEATA
jgi:transcription elongation factor GreA